MGKWAVWRNRHVPPRKSKTFLSDLQILVITDSTAADPKVAGVILTVSNAVPIKTTACTVRHLHQWPFGSLNTLKNGTSEIKCFTIALLSFILDFSFMPFLFIHGS